MNKEQTNPIKPTQNEIAERTVQTSNDEHVDQDFPGYPHYPSKDDIMDERTDSHRVDVDVENFAGGQNASGINERFIKNKQDVQNDANTKPNEEQLSPDNNK